MARSYPSVRYPGGPYIEPQVNPALRGPKRTGPIGELVPGDDVEVARILARLGRKPKKEPISYAIKLASDIETETQITATTTPFGSDLPQYVFNCPRDLSLLTLVAVDLQVSTVSSSGDIEMWLVNLTRSEDEGEDINMLMTDFPVIIEEGNYADANPDELPENDLAWEINWDNAQVQWRDRIGIYFPQIGTGALGHQLHLWFR